MTDPMTIHFTIHGRPQPRGSKRAFMRPGMRHPVIVDANAKSRPWMQEVAEMARLAMNGSALIDSPVQLEVTFHFARPKGHFGKRNYLKPSAPEHHTKKPDSTKLIRGLEDALKGIVWRDDSQVVLQVVSKRYGEFDHTEVTISEIA